MFYGRCQFYFYGDRLLTTENPQAEADKALFAKLGLYPEAVEMVSDDDCETALMQRIATEQDKAFFYNAAESGQ